MPRFGIDPRFCAIVESVLWVMAAFCLALSLYAPNIGQRWCSPTKHTQRNFRAAPVVFHFLLQKERLLIGSWGWRLDCRGGL
jgi:hypothetical protein